MAKRKRGGMGVTAALTPRQQAIMDAGLWLLEVGKKIPTAAAVAKHLGEGDRDGINRVSVMISMLRKKGHWPPSRGGEAIAAASGQAGVKSAAVGPFEPATEDTRPIVLGGRPIVLAQDNGAVRTQEEPTVCTFPTVRTSEINTLAHIDELFDGLSDEYRRFVLSYLHTRFG